jgi:hypothetical protein
MVHVRLISKDEAQVTRRRREPGPRVVRMREFDGYAQTVAEHPDDAVVFEELGEEGQKFVLSLRGALKRAGIHAVVRKMRGRDEVRVWRVEPATTARPRRGAVAMPSPAGRGRRKAS